MSDKENDYCTIEEPRILCINYLDVNKDIGAMIGQAQESDGYGR
ncbi:hypothetical protein CE91St64_08280 [Faecalicatena contorta]|nr:hypothetical protein CE91St64_08280 [Faecalicatena contorta]